MLRSHFPVQAQGHEQEREREREKQSRRQVPNQGGCMSTSCNEPKKSCSIVNLFNIFTRSTTPPPRPAASAVGADPIAESPSREIAQKSVDDDAYVPRTQ